MLGLRIGLIFVSIVAICNSILLIYISSEAKRSFWSINEEFNNNVQRYFVLKNTLDKLNRSNNTHFRTLSNKLKRLDPKKDAKKNYEMFDILEDSKGEHYIYLGVSVIAYGNTIHELITSTGGKRYTYSLDDFSYVGHCEIGTERVDI